MAQYGNNDTAITYMKSSHSTMVAFMIPEATLNMTNALVGVNMLILLI